MGKRIKVVTKCGETSYHDFDQDVDTVEIVEKISYNKKAEIEGWTIYYFDDSFLIINKWDKSDRFEFVHESNGWVNTCKSPSIHKGGLMNDI